MSSKVLKTIAEYAVLTLGCFIFALAWEGFVIPNNMSSGGMMGICTIIQYATGGFLPASAMYLVLNVILLLFAFIAMGLGFGIRTIYCIGMSTVLMGAVEGLPFLQSVAGQFFYIKDPVLIPLISGLLEGLGLGLVFKYQGSTGGTDILAIFVNKHWPVSTGTFFLVSDFIIITSILFLPGKLFCDMLYGYIMMIVSSLMIDYITVGSKSSVQVLVFSQRYEQIADHIINDLDRGVTLVQAKGWYSKSEKPVLLIVIRKKQLFEVTKLIKSIDSKAFVSVSQASSVYGEGFEEIKVGITKKTKNETKNQNPA